MPNIPALDDDRIRMNQAVRRFRFAKETIRRWFNFCPALGRPLKAWPDAKNAKFIRISIADLEAVTAKLTRSGKPLDDFDDVRGTWIWASLVPVQYGLSRPAIKRWSEEGCEPLGGKPLKIRTVYYAVRGRMQARDYIRLEDIKTIVRAPAPSRVADSLWMPWTEAVKVLSAPTLIRFSNTRSKQRKRKPQKHPILKRAIKTDIRRVFSGGRTVRQVWFFRAHIDAIVKGVPESDNWKLLATAARHHNCNLSYIDSLIDAYKVPVQRMAIGRGLGRPYLMKHVFMPDLATAIAKRGSLAKAPPLGEPGRAFFDIEGTWWPSTDAQLRSAVDGRRLNSFRKACEHFPDRRPIRWKRIKRRWFNSPAQSPLVYLEADLDVIRSASGLPPLDRSEKKQVAAGSLAERFVPSGLQEDILKALEGVAMKTRAISATTGRAKLYAGKSPSGGYLPGGIEQLRELGWIARHPVIGFFRPDKPPIALSTVGD